MSDHRIYDMHDFQIAKIKNPIFGVPVNIEIKKETIDNISPDPHSHKFYEIEYIYEGSGTLRINDQTYELKRGLIYFLNPYEFRSYETDHPITIFHIAFDSSMLNSHSIFSFSEQKYNVYVVGNINQTEFILDLIYEEYCNPTSLSYNIIQGLIYKLINNYFVHLSILVKAPGLERSLNSKEVEIIRPFIQYIVENSSKNLTVKEIANKFGYSSGYLSRLFKQIVGIPLKEYMNNIRIETIKTLLKESNSSIEQISVMVGFDNVSNMSRSFKKLCGVSPLEYRKNHSPRYK